jgi:hypothetical protein
LFPLDSDVLRKVIGFWRDDKLRQLSKPLIRQVAVCCASFHDQRRLLQNALNALADTVTDDSLLKSINLDILMHTRSEDATLRTYALSCSEMIWQNHGGKLIGTSDFEPGNRRKTNYAQQGLLQRQPHSSQNAMRTKMIWLLGNL